MRTRPRLISLMVAAAFLGPGTAAWAQMPISPLSPVLSVEAQQPRRAPFTLTPSITVSEEYNDNIFISNADRQSDFITGFTPAISAVAESPIYRFSGSYDFTAEIFADHSDLNRAFARQHFLLSGLYRFTPRLSASLSESFRYDTNTNQVTLEGVATGRNPVWSNTISPGVTYEATPRTTLRLTGAYTTTRFEQGSLSNSDTYLVDGAVDYAFLPVLTGTFAYQFGFFQIADRPDTYTHTPRVGATYRITPTLTASASAGPTFVVQDSDTRVTPAATVSVVQRFSWGSLSGLYDRAVGTSGGLGGTSTNQAFGAVVQVTALLKGLSVDFGPRYTTVESSDNTLDVKTLTLPLNVVYHFTPGIAVVGSYIFFQQRAQTGGAVDADQNRVFLGLTFGYPIRID